MFTREALTAQILESLPFSSADCPFEDDGVTTVYRHAENRKWFGLYMRIPRSRLGLSGNGEIGVLNVKTTPEDGFAVRDFCPAVLPAYHMNKLHWLSVPLDGSVPDALVLSLVEKSFALTAPKRKKKENTHEF